MSASRLARTGSLLAIGVVLAVSLVLLRQSSKGGDDPSTPVPRSRADGGRVLASPNRTEASRGAGAIVRLAGDAAAGECAVGWIGIGGARGGQRARVGETIVLPARGEYLLRVRPASGRASYYFVSVHQELQLDLPTTAAVEVVLSDAGGPRVGVPARLVPARTSASLGHGWEAQAAVEEETRARRVEHLERALAGELAPGALARTFAGGTRAGRDAASETLDEVMSGARPARSTLFSRIDDFGPLAGETAADGTFEWPTVPAGVPYRWGSASLPSGVMDPPHELDVGGGAHPVEFSRRVPPGLSGVFVPAPGEHVSFHVDCSQLGSVRGRLEGYGEHDGAQGRVRLRRRVPIEGDAQGERVGWIEVARAVPASDGRFVVEGVEAGELRVNATWRSGDEVWAFAGAALTLEPGENRDLGLLSPRAGHTLTARVRLVDAGGAELNEVLRPEGVARCEVVVASRRDVAPGHDILERLAPRIGGTFELQGLGAGTHSVTVELARPDLPALREGYVLRSPNIVDVEVAIPMAEPLVIDYVVAARGGLVVRVPFPAPPGGAALGYGLAVPDSGRCERLLFRWLQEESCAEARLALPAGGYRVLGGVSSVSGGEPGLWFDERVVVPPDPEGFMLHVPDTRAAARVHGRASKPDGSPASRLQLTPGELEEPCGNRWLFSITTDEDGGFALPFLPPETDLTVYRGSRALSAGPPASDREMEILLDR